MDIRIVGNNGNHGVCFNATLLSKKLFKQTAFTMLLHNRTRKIHLRKYKYMNDNSTIVSVLCQGGAFLTASNWEHLQCDIHLILFLMHSLKLAVLQDLA